MTPQPLTDTESSTVADVTIDVWLLTQRDCAFCEQAKNVLRRLSYEHLLSVTEIALESVEGRALALQHGVMFAPGVFINGTLASYGRPSERRLRRILTQHQTQAAASVGVAVFFFAPSVRHFLPLLASLACPLSMAAMMFGASKLGKNKPASSSATRQISNATPNVEVTASAVDLRESLRDANLADLRARIAELEKAEPKTRA